MQNHRPTRPAPATPMHEFLVQCARPDAPLTPHPPLTPLTPLTPHPPAPAPRRDEGHTHAGALADFDSMFWCPPHLDGDAA